LLYWVSHSTWNSHFELMFSMKVGLMVFKIRLKLGIKIYFNAYASKLQKKSFIFLKGDKWKFVHGFVLYYYKQCFKIINNGPILVVKMSKWLHWPPFNNLRSSPFGTSTFLAGINWTKKKTFLNKKFMGLSIPHFGFCIGLGSIRSC